jgi:hypothetical protein
MTIDWIEYPQHHPDDVPDTYGVEPWFLECLMEHQREERTQDVSRVTPIDRGDDE